MAFKPVGAGGSPFQVRWPEPPKPELAPKPQAPPAAPPREPARPASSFEAGTARAKVVLDPFASGATPASGVPAGLFQDLGRRLNAMLDSVRSAVVPPPSTGTDAVRRFTPEDTTGTSVDTTASTVTPERRAELEGYVTGLETRASAAVGPAIEDLPPAEAQVVIDAALARWLPPDQGELPALVDSIAEYGSPEVQTYAAESLYQRSVDATGPVMARSYATGAAQVAAASPEAASALLSRVGADGMPAFVQNLSLTGTDSDNPSHTYGWPGRADVTGQLMSQVATLPPSGAQAALVLGITQQAGGDAWRSTDFGAGMAAALSSVMALGNAGIAGPERERLTALFGNGHIQDALAALPEDQRPLLIIHLLDNPGLTAALVDEHQGNLSTAQAYLDMKGLTEGLTGPFAAGTVPRGPDGQPLIPADATLAPPDAAMLEQHPEIAALEPPLTAARIADAIRLGEISTDQAADYVEHLAEHSAALADPDLTRYGAEPYQQAVIELLNGNPILKTNTDDYANLNANSLLAVADAMRGSTDPDFIAQAMVAASAQDGIFRESLPRYGDAILLEGARTQANRQRAVIVGSLVVSVAAPVLAAQAIPLTASLSIGGQVLGGQALRAAAAIGTTGLLSTTLNVANQQGTTGQVQWGNALLGGATDMLGAYFGMRLTQGLTGLRAVATAASVNSFSGLASYALGTPGALEGLINGDPKHVEAALTTAGFSFVTGAVSEGVGQIIRSGPPPRGIRVEGSEVPYLGASNGLLDYGQAEGALLVKDMLQDPGSVAGLIVAGLEGRLGHDIQVRIAQPGEVLIDATTGGELVDPITNQPYTVDTAGGFVDEKNGVIYLGPDANVNVLIHEAGHAIFLANRGHWGWGTNGGTPPTLATLAQMELHAYGKNINETQVALDGLNAQRDALDPATQQAEYTRLSERIGTMEDNLGQMKNVQAVFEQQLPLLQQLDTLEPQRQQVSQRMDELRAGTTLTDAELIKSNPEFKALDKELTRLDKRIKQLNTQLTTIEQNYGFDNVGS